MKKLYYFILFFFIFSYTSFALNGSIEFGGRRLYSETSQLSTDIGFIGQATLYFPTEKLNPMQKLAYVAEFDGSFFSIQRNAQVSSFQIINADLGFDYNFMPEKKYAVHAGLLGGFSFAPESRTTRAVGVGFNGSPFVTFEIDVGPYIAFLRLQNHYYMIFGDIHTTNMNDMNLNLGFKIDFNVF